MGRDLQASPKTTAGELKDAGLGRRRHSFCAGRIAVSRAESIWVMLPPIDIEKETLMRTWKLALAFVLALRGGALAQVPSTPDTPFKLPTF